VVTHDGRGGVAVIQKEPARDERICGGPGEVARRADSAGDDAGDESGVWAGGRGGDLVVAYEVEEKGVDLRRRGWQRKSEEKGVDLRRRGWQRKRAMLEKEEDGRVPEVHEAGGAGCRGRDGRGRDGGARDDGGVTYM
jgi:hypothetical protein